MSYVTRSAEEIVDTIQIAVARNRDKAARDEDAYARGLYTGWADALEFCAEVLIDNLERVEAEARLIPDPEPDIMAFADALVREHFGTAA